jgi:hypothetical protein
VLKVSTFGMAQSDSVAVVSEIGSPVAAAGRVLDVVRFIERHNIKRDGAQKGTVQAARVGFKVGVSAQDVTKNNCWKAQGTYVVIMTCQGTTARPVIRITAKF